MYIAMFDDFSSPAITPSHHTSGFFSTIILALLVNFFKEIFYFPIISLDTPFSLTNNFLSFFITLQQLLAYKYHCILPFHSQTTFFLFYNSSNSSSLRSYSVKFTLSLFWNSGFIDIDHLFYFFWWDFNM